MEVLTTNKFPANLVKYALLAAFSFAAGLHWNHVKNKVKRRREQEAVENVEGLGILSEFVPYENLLESEKLLMKEQFSRGEQFLGESQQLMLDNAFVIVVGAGGVGSHCAHFLARSGIRRIRIIDFDNVTLSSLNRHAVATRKDVGTPKVVCLKKFIHEVSPYCTVDDVRDMFTAENAAKLLSGNPDYVVDAIDDRQTKVALLAHCIENNLQIISSMGSGGKADPTRVHIAPFRDVVYDPLASRLRLTLSQYLRRHQNKNIKASDFGKLEVVYSSEPAHVKLLPIDSEVAGVDASDLGTVPNFRIRVMPVLGPLPAIFGMTIAVRVVTNLAKSSFLPTPCPGIKRTLAHTLRQKLMKRVVNLAARIQKRPFDPIAEYSPINWSADIESLGEDEIVALVSLFCQRCFLKQTKMGSGGKFELMPWRYDRPLSPSNLVLCSESAARIVEDLLIKGKLPTVTNLMISEDDYNHILRVQNACLGRRQLEKISKNDEYFSSQCQAVISRLNNSDYEVLNNLLKECCGLNSISELKISMISRDGLTVSHASDDSITSVVKFPSRLIHVDEMNETILKLANQATTGINNENVFEPNLDSESYKRDHSICLGT